MVHLFRLLDINILMDSLFLHWQRLVEKVKLHAYKNVSNIIPLDETSALNFSKPLVSFQAGPSGAAHQGQ